MTTSTATRWIGVKRVLLSRWTLLAVIGAGLLTARLAGPAEAAGIAIALALGVELTILAIVVSRIPRLIRRLRRDAALPAIIRIADALEDAGVPRWFARFLTMEASFVWLALTGWFRRAPRDGFSSHRTHGTLAIHAVFVFLVVVEAVVLHLLLVRVSLVGAWISTGSSIYALLWFLGDAHGLRLGRIRIVRDALVIEIGRRWAAVVPRHTIAAVHRETAVPEGAIDLSLESPTVAIELSAPITARGPFGRTRTGSRLALTIDDADGFVAALAG